MKCEGYIRHGGAFTIGPVKWEQCMHDAIVELEFKQKKEPAKKLPACKVCWLKCIQSKDVEIIAVSPVIEDAK